MNRVTKRATALYVLVLLLVGGLFFFLFEYATKADTWVISPGSPHVYNSTNIGCGQVVDRNSVQLLDITESRSYAEDPAVRMSTLHWLGDRQGRISAPAIANYAREMTGYDMVNGLYSYTGNGGLAELTLSSELQSVALKAMGDRKGTVAVYNYKTGEILCAVTTPTYDPDSVPDIEADTTGSYEGVYLNRFVQSAYIPGSIFKVVTTAAALDSVEDILDRTFTCDGVYEYGIDRVTCQKAHGTLTLKQALAKSCNCSFAQIANLVGRENLQKYADQFQVTAPISFDGITTAAGNFDLTDAAPVEIAWGGIGQYTDQVNPCRFMTFMGMIAGGGRAASPYLVSLVVFEEEVTYEAQTRMTDRVMDEQIAQTLKEYMRNNVETVYGTDRFPDLKVCAKTGTSELGGDQKPNAMFAGFVDEEEYPLAFMVVVENGGVGNQTCVPIISEILTACKAMMDAQ